MEVNSTDPYGKGIITYLEKWADLMEEKLAEGHKLVDIAQETSHKANEEGITGFMYGAATNILSQVWEHGEELRVLHNAKYGHSGAGCVNPAIITVETNA